MSAPPAATPRGATIDREAPGGARLHGRRLLIARAAWASMTLLAVGLRLAGLPVCFDPLRSVRHTSNCFAAPYIPPLESEAMMPNTRPILVSPAETQDSLPLRIWRCRPATIVIPVRED